MILVFFFSEVNFFIIIFLYSDVLAMSKYHVALCNFFVLFLPLVMLQVTSGATDRSNNAPTGGQSSG